MTTTTQIPATQNEAWGFWGTMTENAAAAWPMAMTAIAEATGQPPDAVRAFLDSRHGRHFADDVLNQMHAGLALVDAVPPPPNSGWAGRSGARPASSTASRAGCPTSRAS